MNGCCRFSCGFLYYILCVIAYRTHHNVRKVVYIEAHQQKLLFTPFRVRVRSVRVVKVQVAVCPPRCA